MSPSSSPRFLTIEQFRREYPVGRTLLYDLIREGKVREHKAGGRTLIPRSELDRLEQETLSARSATSGTAA